MKKPAKLDNSRGSVRLWISKNSNLVGTEGFDPSPRTQYQRHLYVAVLQFYYTTATPTHFANYVPEAIDDNVLMLKSIIPHGQFYIFAAIPKTPEDATQNE